MNDAESPRLLERSPWPATGIDNYGSIFDGEWGYLSIFDDAPPRFEDVRPSEEEIIKRWGEAMLRNTPPGVLARKLSGAQLPLQVVEAEEDGVYFIGTLTREGELVSRESIESWPARMDAVKALLTGVWTQRAE